MWVSSILYIIIVKFLIFIKVDLMRILMYNMLWRCIEAVITSLTRNQVVTFSWHESSNLFASVKFKRGCEKTRLSFFTSPFLHLLCIDEWNHTQKSALPLPHRNSFFESMRQFCFLSFFSDIYINYGLSPRVKLPVWLNEYLFGQFSCTNGPFS